MIVLFSTAVLCLVAVAPAFAQIGNDGFEFQVNNETAGEQQRPRVARLSDGKFVIAWDSEDQDGSENGVYARLYGAGDAGPVDTEFRLNAHTDRSQENVAVAGLAGGKFVAVWESFRQISTATNDDIFGRIFDGAGDGVTAEFQVNQTTASEQTFPSVAARADGSFVVVWTSRLQDGDEEGVFARRFTADGAAIADEFAVNTIVTDAQTTARSGASAVAWYDDDHFVVVWQSEALDPTENAVAARRFLHDGTPLDEKEFQVNVITDGNQANPGVASIGDDTFLVVWNDRRSDGATFLRRYDGNGVALGEPFSAGEASTVSKPAVALDEVAGTFGVVWTDLDSNSSGIIGRRYDAMARPISGRVIVNTFQTAAQIDPQLIAGPGDEFVVVWESVGQDGDGRGIFGQRLSGQGLCGDAVFDEKIAASDALAVLRAAVGSIVCSPCICDVNSSGAVNAPDALAVLKRVVGQAIDLACPAC